MHFYAFFNRFSALFFPYIAHEWTAQNLILSVRLSLVALRSFSYWAPSLPKCRFAQEQRAFERFQRAMRPALLDPQNCFTSFFLHTISVQNIFGRGGGKMIGMEEIFWTQIPPFPSKSKPLTWNKCIQSFFVRLLLYLGLAAKTNVFFYGMSMKMAEQCAICTASPPQPRLKGAIQEILYLKF